MPADPAARVAAKFQAVYDSADSGERAVLDEFGALLGIVCQLAGTEAVGEVVGFGRGPTARRPGSVKGQFEDAMKDLEAADKSGNFEIQDLMSTFDQSLTLSGMLGGRWPPG